MRTRRTIDSLIAVALIATALFISFCAPALAANLVPESVRKIIDAYKIPHDSISLIVQDVNSDVPLVGSNLETPRNPASIIKLLTTFVALEVLGPAYTWPTKLYALGPISNEVLDGDLLLKGHGDPNLVVEQFWKMLGQLRSLGVATITGDLLIDDSYFAVPKTDSGAFDRQPYRLYNVIPNAAMVNLKATEFQFNQTDDGRHVQIRTYPEMPNLKITNKLTIKKGKCRGYQLGINMSVPNPSVADHVIFSGAFPSACRSHSLPRSVLTHASYTFGTFTRLWAHWGGTIAGTYRSGIAPIEQLPLVIAQSRPLAEIIRDVNKWSNNVMTRSLLYSLASAKFNPPFTKEQGIEVLREYLQQHGLDDSKLLIDNGAGLSRDSKITVKLMNGLLRLAYRSPYRPEFIASMSINGVDGTTRRLFRGRPEAGRMHLKTGRLDSVSAITGYVTAKSGKMYSLALLINHKIAHRGPGNEIQTALLKWVYAQ